LLIFASLLLASAALMVAAAVYVSRRPGPGTRSFLWLSAATVIWCAAGAGHAMAGTLAAKILWAKAQYFGIASVVPLWLLFTAEYSGAPWFRRGSAVRAPMLWAVPVITLALAVTNEWHHAIWSSVTLAANGRAVYSYGPWFWIAASYNYALLLTGSAVVVRMVRKSPGPLRTQFVAMLVGAGIPWACNILYLAGIVTIDLTSLGFAVSGILFGWAAFYSHLFDLVPVARDVVIDSLSDAMIVLDGSRRILDMNAAGRTLALRKGTITSDRQSWLGREVDDVFPLLRGALLAPMTVVSTSPLLKTAGEPAAFDVQVLPVHVGGRFEAWVVLMRDVTDQRRAAADREALQQRIQEQQRRESLSILAGGLAHDFNNLLAGIVGNADLLALQVPASSSMGDSVGAILLGAQRAADLVSKMLAYAGERHGSMARIDVDEVTRDLLDLLRASAARHCAISYQGASAVIDADATQFRQVAMNLIINAAEAVGDAGNVTITTGRQTLSSTELATMRVGQDAAPGDYAFLEVRDEGVGMDAETVRHLFQPFFTTKSGGHGLGLAAVQGIVMGHRGALRVTTEPGKGTCFCVWFPTTSVRRDDSAAGAAPEARSIFAATV
jgi:signal transduction histidine kinase